MVSFLWRVNIMHTRYSTVSLTDVSTDNPQIDTFVWIIALEEIVQNHNFIEFFTATNLKIS